MQRLKRARWLTAILMLALSLSGCYAAPLADHELCRIGRRNVEAGADGQTAPYPVTVGAGQRVQIRYVAEFTEGSAEFRLEDQATLPVWREAVRSSGSVVLAQAAPSLPGQYNVVLKFNKMGNHTVCWIVDVTR